MMNMILCRWSYKSYPTLILAKYVLQNVNQNIFLNITAAYMLNNILFFVLIYHAHPVVL